VSHIRLLSCNLYNGRADPAALAEVLSSTAPDVVATQELAPNAAAVLRDALPYGRLEPSINYRGMGISLRYPADVAPFALPHRDGLIATLDPSAWPALDSALDIVSLHLANPIDRPFGATRRIRRDQVAAVVRHVARTSSPIAIVGDLNATPAWPVYRRLIRVLRDGVHDTGSTHRTWGPTWWFPRVLRIDHALVRGGVSVTNATTVRLRGADHSGLLVDLDVV